MNLLIVDDERIGRESLKALLFLCDFNVLTAGSLAEATELAGQHELDVAVVDWVLGSGVDGLTVADALKAVHPEIRIVIVSGHSNLQSQRPEVGVYPVLAKPFELAELLAVIQ